METKRFTGQAPLQEHETFSKNTSCRFLKKIHEGLCAQVYYFRFEIIGGLRSHLLFLFFERQNTSKKTAVSPT